MSRKKKILIGVGIGLAVLLIAAAIFVNYILDLINYQAANSDYFATLAESEVMPEESAIDSELAAIEEAELAEDLEASPEDLLRWNTEIEDITSDKTTYQMPTSNDVVNILLIGTDNRTAGAVGRSDAMILVSINQKTETIYLTSFLRDCYVAIPGYSNTRLNHAFAYGGPDLLMETLQNNFKVHIDRYVAVDFFSFMDVIDVLGGLDLELSEEEVKVTNKYIWSMNKLMDVEWSEDYIWTTGQMHLNGKQVLCYCRDRYTGSDYQRTQRQRNVINGLIQKALSSSPATLVDLCQVVLPQITTDMEKSEILNYAANIMAYLNYDIVSQQVPAPDTYNGATIKGMSVISLDLEENIDFLRSTVYAGTEYGLPAAETEEDSTEEASEEASNEEASSAEESASEEEKS